MNQWPRIGFEYLQKLGFSTLVESRTDQNGKVYSDINVSLALGGLTDGVSNLEITAAYGTIANNGIYNKPILYTKVLDRNGKVLLENKPNPTQVIKTSTDLFWILLRWKIQVFVDIQIQSLE